MSLKSSRTDIAFDLINYSLLLFVGFAALFPFIHIWAKSMSNEYYILAREVVFWPRGFQLSAYRLVLSNPLFLRSFINSVILAVGGTTLNMIATTLAAYPLSRAPFPGQKVILGLYIFTMFFSGGIIPTYLVVRNTGLLNTLWALILPVLVTPFNLIILKSFFYSVPDSLEESARMDGASNFRILLSIMLPLSSAALATLTLFYAVSHWNSYFNALIYITNRSRYPLQLYLREVIIDNVQAAMGTTVYIDADDAANTPPEAIRASTIIAATVPILVIYPFVQKYFVQGIMLGSVKE